MKKITINSMNIGKLNNGNIDVTKSQANDINIFTDECPANILAKSRIPRLIARAIYEINSIKIIKGAITSGVPVGNKIDK